MRYRLYAEVILPVYTVVEADSEEEARTIGMSRGVGDDEENGWRPAWEYFEDEPLDLN